MCKAIQELVMEERRLLRAELQELKTCQVRYFTLSVSATGLLLGFGSRLDAGGFSGTLYLAPLLIVLPCWWIFFDKASSISRIVGYSRLLETQLNQTVSLRPYLGWERALKEFRSCEPALLFRARLANPAENMRVLLCLRPTMVGRGSRHRYWVITWWTFSSLSALCLVVPLLLSDVTSTVASLLFLIPSLYTAAFTAELVETLIHGVQSYDENEALWEQVLPRSAPSDASSHEQAL